MSGGHEGDEPYNPYEEVVDVGTWFHSTDVTVTYRPSSRGSSHKSLGLQ